MSNHSRSLGVSNDTDDIVSEHATDASRSSRRNDNSLGIHQHNNDGLKLLMRIGNRFKKSICLFLNPIVELLLFCLYMSVIPIKYVYTNENEVSGEVDSLIDSIQSPLEQTHETVVRRTGRNTKRPDRYS